ncbi:hypothetical protein CROQUDRAFT_67819 [Cronartium quercuum f. sp. fusiforme G11]|uniref:Importin N-terminal domain-containing protein n=1 Tax=Cronartium quercuum f. sp. fusiforme G11 TaxID=708437 RepID=A0A9P6NCW0_9BASI|nr:hypothetical protein CROQUDRAFT_67819 [Cronartium quercuum f. sp. fusiforme G11]
MTDPIKELSQQLSSLYTDPDPNQKAKANEWLQNFQKTEEAWITSDLILRASDSPLESKLFAAQTFRAKITFDLEQLSPPHRLQLRDSLLNALTEFATGPAKIILVQLCLSLADLALQLPEWPTVVGDMTEKFGKSPETVPILLEFLTVLPQEVLGNHRIKITNQWSSPQASQLVSDTLSMYLAAQGITSAIKCQVFKCLSAWLRAGEVAASVVGTPNILSSAFEALSDDILFEDAVDVIVDLIHETQEINDNMALIERIVTCLIALQSKLAQDRDEPDKMRGYCRIYVEAGEWYTPLIIQHPDTFLPIVQAIRSCCDYEDLDVVGITFNFWYRLSKKLHQKRNEGTVKPLLDIFASLVETIIGHLHYPEDLSTHAGQEADDFRRFRHDIGDTLKDCCYVLGASVCLKRSYDMIVQALGRSTTARWQDIEAPLFSMRTMGAEVDPKDDQVLPLIMSIIPKLPAHPKIQYATILVLCRYTEWTSFHPEGIPFQLQYISSGFQDPNQEVRLAAAQAMKFLCQDCSQHLVSFLPQLHTFYQTISSTLGRDDMFELSGAIAHIIAVMPPHEASSALQSFCMPLVEKLHVIVVQKQPADKQVLEQLTDILETLDAFLSIVPSLGDKLQPDCSKTLEQIWTVLDGVLGLYDKNSRVSERTCTVIRRGLQFFGPLCLPLLVNVIDRMTTSFEQSGCPSFMWITSKVITAFAETQDPALESCLKIAFERQSTQAFATIKDAGPQSASDVMDDYIHLLLALFGYYPKIIASSPCFSASFPIVLASLELYDPGPLSDTLDYVRELLGHESLGLQRATNGINAPPAPAGFALLAAPIRSVVGQFGFPLCEVLLRRVLSDLPEDLSSSVFIVFRLLSENFPNELSSWVPSIIEQLPSKLASVNDKAVFMETFKNAITQGRAELVKEAILTLFTASRRERARERFNAER